MQALAKSWGDARAVRNVDFAAAAGSLVVLLGPSGCGKSTTLRLVAGLEAPDAGRIHIGGRDITGLAAAQRGLAMVFQSYALFPHLSVAENILFGLKVRQVPPAERAARLARTADLLGIGGLLDRRPAQLSGGQQQRVALGRAIVAQAPVCLMDEPLSNLDAQLRHEMRREIRALQQRLGMTMLYVTHDQVEAMTMADQVILMRDGRVEQDAPPELLYARPATAFVASFIGTPPMNLFPVAEDGLLSGVCILQPGQALTYGVRPEAIRPVAHGGLPATVINAEYLGADTLLACRSGGAALTVRLAGNHSVLRGANLRLGWSSSDAHLFDSTDGRRRDDLRSLLMSLDASFSQPLNQGV